MFYRFKDALIDLIVYTLTVVICFSVTGLLVMLVAQPLFALSYAQALSATVLTFLFFFIGKVDFNVDDEDEY